MEEKVGEMDLPPRISRPVLRRAWLPALLGLALLLAVLAIVAVRWFWPESKSALVASFRSDFRPERPAPGWRYLWNRNGPPGDFNGYEELVWNGTAYATTESELPAPPPARFLHLTMNGGHPGLGAAQSVSQGVSDEASVVTAFSVPEAGRYRIQQSFISRPAGLKGGYVVLRVFINAREAGSAVYCRNPDGVSFDRPLGALAGGDTVYVLIGPGETAMDDAFGLDFAIERY